ncbi:MAG TPA: SUF system Fe-S cluster assembly regulator [Alphaproteobacteria bacterium]|nr:SUF system Fe-S cluster assembly regulator [Alphaproteobacteria bacterium]USO06329.1 MAG: SUF system Fe-S cluster assembly regulator [Rhodospirillales bacterium]HOO81136.1 SUF system Fe-S cluster assembly regulator [Alphaproteobacteria bacterium]
MIKISRLADYAVVTLAELAQQKTPVSAVVVAGQTRLPEPTVAKVLKLLAKAGLVQSIRGVNGGYQLKKPPAQIDVAQIVAAIEGPVSLTACVEGSTDICNYQKHCSVKGRWDDVHSTLRKALESVTLADMMARPKGCSQMEKRYKCP